MLELLLIFSVMTGGLMTGLGTVGEGAGARMAVAPSMALDQNAPLAVLKPLAPLAASEADAGAGPGPAAAVEGAGLKPLTPLVPLAPAPGNDAVPALVPLKPLNSAPTAETRQAILVPLPPLVPAEPDFTPEAQTPTGKFTTATEVSPILAATRANWIAIREYDGRDLVYFTHLESWRCGLHAILYGLNGAPATMVYPMAACDPSQATPNALPAAHLPYLEMPLKSVFQVDIRLILDDGSEQTGQFSRQSVLMP